MSVDVSYNHKPPVDNSKEPPKPSKPPYGKPVPSPTSSGYTPSPSPTVPAPSSSPVVNNYNVTNVTNNITHNTTNITNNNINVAGGNINQHQAIDVANNSAALPNPTGSALPGQHPLPANQQPASLSTSVAANHAAINPTNVNLAQGNIHQQQSVNVAQGAVIPPTGAMPQPPVSGQPVVPPIVPAPQVNNAVGLNTLAVNPTNVNVAGGNIAQQQNLDVNNTALV